MRLKNRIIEMVFCLCFCLLCSCLGQHAEKDKESSDHPLLITRSTDLWLFDSAFIAPYFTITADTVYVKSDSLDLVKLGGYLPILDSLYMMLMNGGSLPDHKIKYRNPYYLEREGEIGAALDIELYRQSFRILKRNIFLGTEYQYLTNEMLHILSVFNKLRTYYGIVESEYMCIKKKFPKDVRKFYLEFLKGEMEIENKWDSIQTFDWKWEKEYCQKAFVCAFVLYAHDYPDKKNDILAFLKSHQFNREELPLLIQTLNCEQKEVLFALFDMCNNPREYRCPNISSRLSWMYSDFMKE